jgi:hypothetical protein
MPVPEHAASGSSYEALKGLLPRLASAIQALLAALREIFDESAYDRFLLRARLPRSTESYRAFMQEEADAMAKRSKCC